MTNVVLLCVDCLRADHMGYYGYHRDTTPFLDQLAKKSLVCRNAFSNGPNTRHSVPSFLTSTYPLLFLQESQTGRLHPGRRTVAEVLRDHGFATGAVHSNPYVSKFYGYDRGFDYFNDFLLGQVEDEADRGWLRKMMGEAVKGVKAVFMRQLPHEDGKAVNREALRWLDSVDEPFFLWMQYMDVHMPYVPPNHVLKELGLRSYSHPRKIWMGKKIDDVNAREKIRDDEVDDYVNLYDGCIRYVDQVIKEFVHEVEKRFDDTIFVLFADHGEEFREHGGLSHVEKLYDELLHVPLFFYGDGVTAKTVYKPVSLLSLAPTLFDFMGLKHSRWFQGESVFDADDDFVIAEAHDEGEVVRAYRDKQWKLIQRNGEYELYDVKDDPKERQDLYNDEEYSKEAKEYTSILKKHALWLEEEQKKYKTWLQKTKISEAAKRVQL